MANLMERGHPNEEGVMYIPSSKRVRVNLTGKRRIEDTERRLLTICQWNYAQKTIVYMPQRTRCLWLQEFFVKT